MSKTLIEAALSTPKARSRLPEGLHWRAVDADVHLGYRKGKRAGRWLARWYVGAQKYQQEAIGAADDAVEANGVDCLTFEQAKSAAARLVARKRKDAIASADGPAPTVRSAIMAYLTMREAREQKHAGEMALRRDARRRLTRHVLGSKLADTPLHELTEAKLGEWCAELPATLATATVRRLVNDFKAALNAAATKHRAKLPADIAIIVKNGLKGGEASAPVSRDTQALSDADLRRLIDAAGHVDEADGWEGDLLRLVVTMAATGARFSQIARMAVADVQPAQSRVMVPTSRKGKGVKKASHTAMRVGEDVLSTLRPATAGRRGGEPLLERWRHRQDSARDGSPPRWVRNTRGSWRNASDLSRPWRAIIERAGLPDDVVPYALRHSSIVRQLRAGLPVRLVAALHDTSTAMIEAHYSAAIVDALNDLSAGAVIALMPVAGDKVVPLRAGNG